MIDAPETTGWQPFDYSNPPEGVVWLEVERPETWCDADCTGRTIGGFTGETRRVVVLASVYQESDGPAFDRVQEVDLDWFRDGDVARRFMPLTPPEPPHAE